MLQVARLAPNLLHEAAERVSTFLGEQINEDGGGKDRDGKSDLYYTVFAIESLIALQKAPPYSRVQSYLSQFGDGEELDFVHLNCLARGWSQLPKGSLDAGLARKIGDRIESYRSKDGGFGPEANEEGTVYHGFLALGSFQDLGLELREPEAFGRSIAALKLDDGSYANTPDINATTTPTTAAAVTILRHLRLPIPPESGAWLLAQANPDGGFMAVTEAQMPDLLSTATALHALSGLQVPFGHVKEKTLDFVDSLWTGRSFCGNWADDTLDSEYTYYALLSLGHLSLE